MTLAPGIWSSIRAPGSSGAKVMLPAGVSGSIDHEDDEKVYVNRTRERSRARPNSTTISTATTPTGASSPPPTGRAAPAGATTGRRSLGGRRADSAPPSYSFFLL